MSNRIGSWLLLLLLWACSCGSDHGVGKGIACYKALEQAARSAGEKLQTVKKPGAAVKQVKLFTAALRKQLECMRQLDKQFPKTKMHRHKKLTQAMGNTRRAVAMYMRSLDQALLKLKKDKGLMQAITNMEKLLR